MNKQNENPSPRERPGWMIGKNVDEVAFCEEFLREHPLVCVQGVFYSTKGRVPDERLLEQQIYEKLRPWAKSSVASLVDRLLALLRKHCWQEKTRIWKLRRPGIPWQTGT